MKIFERGLSLRSAPDDEGVTQTQDTEAGTHVVERKSFDEIVALARRDR